MGHCDGLKGITVESLFEVGDVVHAAFGAPVAIETVGETYQTEDAWFTRIVKSTELVETFDLAFKTVDHVFSRLRL